MGVGLLLDSLVGFEWNLRPCYFHRTWDATRSDSAYWNGTAWSPTPVFQTAAGLGSWSLPGNLPTGESLLAGGYSVLARATDAAGNTASATTVFSVSPHAQIRPLGVPAGWSESGVRTTGYAINASGQVAGEVDVPGNSPHPMRWDADGKATLLHAGSYGSYWNYCYCRGELARGIDDSGAVSGRLPDGPVKWLPGGTTLRLSPRTGTLTRDAYPLGTNASGTVAGVSGRVWGTWAGSTFSPLPVPTTYPSQAWEPPERYPMSINSAGTVAGTWLTTDPSKPTRAFAVVADSAGASFVFSPDTDGSSYATGINDAGDVVGSTGTADPAGSPGSSLPVPYLRSADGTVTRFPTAPKNWTGATAMDINNSDVIVGFAGEADKDGDGAWVISRGVVKKLADLLPADSGWVLNNAWAINDSGEVVGNGKLHGRSRAFVLTLGGLQQLATPPRVDDAGAGAGITTPEGEPVTVPLTAVTTTTSPLTWSIVDQPAGRPSTRATPSTPPPPASPARTPSPARPTTAP